MLSGFPNSDVTITDAPSGERRAPVIAVAAAVAAGIAIDRWLGPSVPGANCSGWWLASAGLIVAWWMLHQRGRAATASIVLLGSIAALGAASHHWQWNLFADNNFGFSATEQTYPCCIEARAVHAPQRTAAPPTSPYRAIPQGEKSQLLVQVIRVRNGQQWVDASGKCEVIVDGHLLHVRADDRLQVFGQFRAPSPTRNPGQFDYADFARSDRELFFVRCESPACVTVREAGNPWLPGRWIDNLRAAWQARLWSALGSDGAPLAAAILLGDRNAMPRESIDAFRVTGALHVLVVSGLHAGILITGVFALLGLGFVPRKLALAIAMVLVAMYAVLTGGHPPVLRAAILAELACIALWFHRSPFALNSLTVAAIFVLAMNPADLFRTGPQLSFLCVATLIWFSSVRWFSPATPLQILIHNTRPWYERTIITAGRRAGWTMAATAAVWVVSLPLLMYQFHLVTPVAVLACVPLFACLTASLISGCAFLIGGWLVPAAESWLAAPLAFSLRGLENVVHSSSRWPEAYLWTPGPFAWWVIGWFALAGLLLVAGGTRFGWRRTIQFAAAWVIVGAVPVLVDRFRPHNMQATFLDVGHGVCVVVTTPDGTTLLYDAGSLGSPSYAAETIASYLWSRGIRTIDGIVLSHPDVDHFNAVPGLVERFSIGRVFVSPHMFTLVDDPLDRSAPAALKRLLADRGVPVEIVELGDKLTLDASASACVLYPDRLGSFGGDNSNSLVLAIECGPHRILLPGDLEAPGIDIVMVDEPYPCDVLLAPHHGSRRSDPPGFAAWSRPKVVVVSGSMNTADRTVAANYREQGAKLLLTRACGAVSFEFTSTDMHIERFRP